MSDQLTNRRIPYFGDFVLFDEIGRGGMGVVYSAQQTKLDRPVALKVLHSSFAAGGAGVQRLRIEAEAVAKLDHPNIVPIFEFGEHEGHPYLAMQLVEGESLAEYITRMGASLNEREAARLLAKIACAVHHAHQRGVMHRDLKPGNILLDEYGEPHLIDFGLAKCLETDAGMTQTGVFMGTPAFASPEQAAGQNKSITTATDIYSLGAIFYALLTGQPPFAGDSGAAVIEQVKHDSPRRLQTLRSRIPVDLEIICLKCLEKEIPRRYSSALALAEDLGRFLDGRPIAARPVGALQQLWMWTRRNPVNAALWVTGCVALMTPLVGLFLWRGAQVKAAERQLVLRDVQATRLNPHSADWSAPAWARLVGAARIQAGVESDAMRNQAAALLAGLDAHRVHYFTNFGASSVVFDRQGKRLLMGGLGDGAKLWDADSGKIQTALGTNWGPVAFLANGTATQLLYDEGRHVLVLADVVNSRTVTEWKVPLEFAFIPIGQELCKLAVLTPDGAACIVTLKTADGRESVVALSATGAHVLGAPSTHVTAMTVSTDGSLVAVADSTGKISVWKTQDGTGVTEFMAGRSEILSLALQPSVRIPEIPAEGTNGVMLLAAGDSGGMVTIWNLHTQTVAAFCRGMQYQVFSVAFSPDGMTLAAGGRGPVKLWDLATGRHLLDIQTGDYFAGLDFSPDGSLLAIASQGDYPTPNVSICELEFGRGVQTLRGLSAQISRICFSADGRRFAAFSHNWEVGVWDLATGKLLRVFETPKGEFADNGGLTLNADGTRLAMAAQSAAKLWDVQTGTNLASWELPPGLVNLLGFPDDNHLLLFRMETLDAKTPPFSDADPTKYPRVCRIRDLLCAEPLIPIREISDFNRHVYNACSQLDARHFVVEGIHAQDGKTNILFKCFDGLTGKELWMSPSTRGQQSGVVAVDPLGKFLTFQRDAANSALLAELSSGVILKTVDFQPAALHWGPRLYAVNGFPDGSGRDISLFDDSSKTPLITFLRDGEAMGPVSFDAGGTQLGWGNPDGTATICDLNAIRMRLSQVGLAW